MGAIALVVGLIGFGAVIAAIVVFAVPRSRRNSGNGAFVNGTYPQNMGYPPAQQLYPSVLNQGYPAPPGPPSQHPNPYNQ